MSMKINHELPLPEVLKSQYPLSQELKEVKKQRDEEIRRIFTGESDKFIVLVGCLLYTSPSPRDSTSSRMPSSA